MISRSFLTKLVLGIAAAGAVPALAGPSMGHNGGYLPWRGEGFGGYSVSGPAPSQQQPEVYDLAPAVAQAAFAEAQFRNRWIDLQLMLARSRSDFYISTDYVATRKDVEQARSLYESARQTVLDRLQSDKTYKDLIIKRTEQQIALKSTAAESGLRNVVAAEKMR